MGTTNDRSAEAQGGKPVSSILGHAALRSPRGGSYAGTVPSAEKRCVPVREGYERWAPTYDRNPNPLLALEERCLKPLILCLEGKRVLDLACGTGRWLAWLLTQGAASVIGADFSAAMLAVASGKAALQKHLVQAECCTVPFAKGVFDLVICSFALGHILDLESLAREVGRVATANADVYVSDLHPLAYSRGWQTGFRDNEGAVEISTWPRPVRKLLAAWSSAGFRCAQLVECQLGEPERPILARAGKAHLFQEVRAVPAVLIHHFKRLSCL